MLIVDWSPDGPFDKGPPKYHRIGVEVVESELKATGFKVEQLEMYEGFFTIKAGV